jgi:multimeric flavodoxin WrbA
MSTSGTGGRVLGLGCGQRDGSAEILLKAALRAAEDEGAEVELVRLDELRLPSGAAEAAEPDDAWWLWERLVECDGLIVSTPIISRTVAARLKLLGDRLLGPNADAAIIAGLMALRRQGREPAVPFRVDERVLKPRVAGFLAVGGSLTPQWKTLTLPVMHTTTFSMHIAVVDQVQFAGAGTPRSVVLDPAAIDRAVVLGRNVASQLGVTFDEARYLGPPGLCPMCHLDVIALHGADVECATCGARGRLGPGSQVTWTDLSTSVISMEEKQSHAVEIQQTAERHRDLRKEIDERARAFEAYDRTVRPDHTPTVPLPPGRDPAEDVPHGDGAVARVGERDQRPLDGGADGGLAGVLHRPGPARRANQRADRVRRRLVLPDAFDLALAGHRQARGGQRRLDAAGGGQRVGRVVGLAFRGAQRGHGQVHRRGLHPVRVAERGHPDQAAGPADPGRLGERGERVRGELDGVHRGDRVEGGVGERQPLHVREPQVGAGQPGRRHLEQAG